jgi:hypothetical protein
MRLRAIRAMFYVTEADDDGKATFNDILPDTIFFAP